MAPPEIYLSTQNLVTFCSAFSANYTDFYYSEPNLYRCSNNQTIGRVVDNTIILQFDGGVRILPSQDMCGKNSKCINEIRFPNKSSKLNSLKNISIAAFLILTFII
ncbi:hypothetical protein AYI70_g2702 [Smittium culicis]|uniref:Uncharacterized protein n=1 Tax=Smittium culicis TaxID=133412 RepID=A0A1R1Y7C2_9FUNG|nr:hypothetical protein AYI70_g2702 [Smittium culicis]